MKFTKEQKTYLLQALVGKYGFCIAEKIKAFPEEEPVLPVNTVLYTKDGRKFGNAIIQEVMEIPEGTFYRAISDYGNGILINMNEIHEYFLIGAVADNSHKYFTTTNSAK